MDDLTPEQRHKNMQHIRSKNTVPELLVMRELKYRKVYFAKHIEQNNWKTRHCFQTEKNCSVH